MDSLQYRRALLNTGRIVVGVRPEQLALPTPCRDWDVRLLLNHIIGGNHMFAEVARGGDEPPSLVDTGVELITAFPVEGVESRDEGWGTRNCWGG